MRGRIRGRVRGSVRGRIGGRIRESKRENLRENERENTLGSCEGVKSMAAHLFSNHWAAIRSGHSVLLYISFLLFRFS
jgi:hypothetical protein